MLSALAAIAIIVLVAITPSQVEKSNKNDSVQFM